VSKKKSGGPLIPDDKIGMQTVVRKRDDDIQKEIKRQSGLDPERVPREDD
jgi:hypothetical protein